MEYGVRKRPPIKTGGRFLSNPDSPDVHIRVLRPWAYKILALIIKLKYGRPGCLKMSFISGLDLRPLLSFSAISKSTQEKHGISGCYVGIRISANTLL